MKFLGKIQGTAHVARYARKFVISRVRYIGSSLSEGKSREVRFVCIF